MLSKKRNLHATKRLMNRAVEDLTLLLVQISFKSSTLQFASFVILGCVCQVEFELETVEDVH
jgi:hypothetical protein